MEFLTINHTLADETAVRLLVDPTSIKIVPIAPNVAGRVTLTFDYWAGQNVEGRWVGWDPGTLLPPETIKLKNVIRKALAPMQRDRTWRSIQDSFKRGAAVTVEFQINL